MTAMIILVLLLSALVAAMSVLLVARLQKAKKKVTTAGDGPAPLGKALNRFIAHAIDKGLLAGAAANGLADVSLRFKEAHDSFRNTEELTLLLFTSIRSGKQADGVETVKNLYQLQYSLGMPTSDLEECLRLAVGQIVAARPGTQARAVQQGQSVDAKTMFPLNSGSRVRQPLGVVLVDESGKVVSKAKVLCS